MNIYVASLSDYNNGNLHGVWVELSSDVDEMFVPIKAMLKESKYPDTFDENDELTAEEYAIHDYDAPFKIGEYTSLKELAKIVAFIEDNEENGYKEEIIAAVIDYIGIDDLDDAETLLENSHGVYDSFKEYAEQYADECLAIPENIQSYFDYHAFARDLALDFTVIDVPGGVFVASN